MRRSSRSGASPCSTGYRSGRPRVSSSCCFLSPTSSFRFRPIGEILDNTYFKAKGVDGEVEYQAYARLDLVESGKPAAPTAFVERANAEKCLDGYDRVVLTGWDDLATKP